MKVSVITTLKNEVNSIREFMDSLLSQSCPPDEIIIADGGSTDGTVEIIREYIEKGARVNLLVQPGNRSVGRNAATKAAKYEIIACTDVGCKLDKDWVRNIVKPFEDNPSTMTVAGFFEIAPETYFEELSATLMLADHDKIDPETWLPSSRSVAYKKEAWAKAGGYPEEYNLNEDTPFDLALINAGYKFVFTPDALVYWRPRPNLKEFYKQYYAYSRGDGQGLIFWPVFLRKILMYLIGLVMLALGFQVPISWLFLGLGLLLYLTKRARHVLRKMFSLKSILLTPILIVTHDLAEIFGYLKGLTERIFKA